MMPSQLRELIEQGESEYLTMDVLTLIDEQLRASGDDEERREVLHEARILGEEAHKLAREAYLGGDRAKAANLRELRDRLREVE